ncbi:MAG: LptF/LptG family permease [Desulfomonilaceae bacterium]|nr:LptF/LptG family permease [Desulfomonilaceae bacterium]
MLGPSIIARYVFREITVSFLFCFAVFLLTGLIAGFLPLVQKGMETGLELTLILLQLLIFTLPTTLVTVLPPSVLIGILLGLGRMAVDNEISALKSSGISVLHLLPPVLALGLIGTGLSLVSTLYLVPKGVSEAKELSQQALTTRPDAGIEERTFFDRFADLIVYVEEIDSSTGTMSRVFIRESSDPDDIRTIVAKQGKAYPDPEGKAFVVHLRDGTIVRSDRRGDTIATISFPSFVFRYPIQRQESVSFEELPIEEIRRRVKEITRPSPDDTEEKLAYYGRVRNMADILITQRFTHPLACLALALIAFPLGVITMGTSRLNNVTLGLLVIFLYYTLTLATERFARSELAPPELVLPLPFVLFALVSAYLIRCAIMERVPSAIRLFRSLLLRMRRPA